MKKMEIDSPLPLPPPPQKKNPHPLTKKQNKTGKAAAARGPDLILS